MAIRPIQRPDKSPLPPEESGPPTEPQSLEPSVPSTPQDRVFPSGLN